MHDKNRTSVLIAAAKSCQLAIPSELARFHDSDWWPFCAGRTGLADILSRPMSLPSASLGADER